MFIQYSSNLHPGWYILVDRGASCEASGYTRMTSLADCHKALQELGLSHTPKGTVDLPSPQGCYLRFDGDLWYNMNEQSTECTPESNCVCRIGEHFQRSGCRIGANGAFIDAISNFFP